MKFTGAPFDPSTSAMTPLAEGEHAYVYLDHRIALAVNVALVTERPLLVTGLPGSGKSTLAVDVARRLGWAYLGTVITSRTGLEELVARMDLVGRLNDAQRHALGVDADYLVPGALWWAVDPDGATGLRLAQGRDPRRWADRHSSGVVVLLDEIDKAEPDLPNDLLGPLDGLRLTLPSRGERAPTVPALVVITSNGERDMPPAFLRRCISLDLMKPVPDFLVAVAKSHLGSRDDGDELYRSVADRLVQLWSLALEEGRRPPSTAEYLDAVRACDAFDERPGSQLWSAIEEAALAKTRADRSERPGGSG